MLIFIPMLLVCGRECPLCIVVSEGMKYLWVFFSADRNKDKASRRCVQITILGITLLQKILPSLESSSS